MKRRFFCLVVAYVSAVVVPLAVFQTETVQVSADGPGTVWAATSLGPYKSDDGGATWQHVQVVVDNPLLQGNPDPARQSLLQGNVAADALAVDPQNPAAVYFAGKGANAEGLYRSADGGKTWSAKPFLDLYPADAGATQTGVLPTGGATRDIYPWTPGQCRLCIDSAAPNHWYLSFWRSDDAGATWTRMLSPGPNEMLYGIATDPEISGLVYAALGTTINVSHDFGSTWATALAPASQPGTGGIFVNPLNSDVYILGGRGCQCSLLKSSDNGQTWSPVPFSGTASAVDFDVTNGDIYVAGSKPGIKVAVYKSSDGGNTWTPTSPGADGSLSSSTSFETITVDPNATGHALFWNRKPIIDTVVVRTTDAGKTWSGMKLPCLPDPRYPQAPTALCPGGLKVENFAFVTPPRPQRQAAPVTQASEPLPVTASATQPVALRAVQSSAGRFYFVLGTRGWLLVPDAMSDEDLGNISIGGEWHVILADQIQPRPAQVVQGTDGRLYLVQGQLGWVLIADPISDTDFGALAVSGEIDGTVQDGFLVNPSAVLIATPAPAAPSATSGVPDTLTDSVRADILSAVNRANTAWTQAKATLDTSVLGGAVAGSELSNDLAEVDKLRALGHSQKSVNTAFTVKDVALDAPGHATVHTTETWSAEIKAATSGQLLQRIPAMTYSETYTVDYLNDGWIVTLNELH